MPVNKKGQGMIIDIILLVLISSIFFIFLSSQSTGQSMGIATARSQSTYSQHMLLSILNYHNGSGTVAELIGADYCFENMRSEINSSVHNAFSSLDIKNSYFIFIYGNSSNRVVYNNVSCVKTESINLATFNMSLPCQDNIIVSFGYWSKSQKVEIC